MISKGLLSEVLKRDVPLNSKGFNIAKISNNTVMYGVEFAFKREINIHELAHKCKEWAYSKKYIIYSSLKSASIYKDLIMTYNSSNEPTEPEAIFKACQWILDKE